MSLPDVRSGAQRPRLASCPPFFTSAGDDAVDLAAAAGLILDDWQRYVLTSALGERRDGKWVTSDVGLVVSRQNGKNAVLEARELAGLFLFGEQLIIHTAHEMKAAAVTFRRIVGLINATPDLKRRVKNIAYSKGDEGVELHNGNRLRFMARTGGSGRSFSADTLILDEAYNLPGHVMSALTPTLAARPNPQTWYTSSAVNAMEHPNGLTLARLRRRALGGDDPRLAYFEWSGDETEFAADPKGYAADRHAWALANPGLGIRIPEEFLADQLRRMGPRPFAVEHMSIGDWPEEPDTDVHHVIDPERWVELVDRLSRPLDPVSFGVHAALDRSSASVSVAAYRADGLVHLEVVEQRRGVAWVVGRVAELWRRQSPCAVVIDPGGPAGSLILPLEQEGVEVKQVTAREYGQACGSFYDKATVRDESAPSGALRHQDDERLTAALENVQTRPLGAAWAWDAKSTTVDISPLVAATLALHGLTVFGANDGTVNLW